MSDRLATDVTGRGAADLSNDALARNLLALRRAIDHLESAFAGFLAVFDERGACRDSGSVTTVSWLRQHAHMAGAAASERVRIARRLEQLPTTSGAFAAGAHTDPLSDADGSHLPDQPPGRPGLSYGHVAVIARMADDVGRDHAVAAEPILIEAARQVDPDSLRKVARRLRHCVDADGAQADANKAHTRRRLHVSETMDGLVVLDGLLDPESGAVLRTALNAAMTAPSSEDGRCAAQRRADALVDIAQHAMDAGQLPESGGVRPHLAITADAATFLRDGPLREQAPDPGGLRGSTRPVMRSSGSGDDVAGVVDSRRANCRSPADFSQRTPSPGRQPLGRLPGDAKPRDDTQPPDHVQSPGGAQPRDGTQPRDHIRSSDHAQSPAGTQQQEHTQWLQGPQPPPQTPGGQQPENGRQSGHGPPPAEVEGGSPMPSESARRMACDASFARVLLGPDSQPLDVGRSTRIIPPAIRRALNVRDGGCAFPGCDRPASWCEAHHIEHWVDGGSTSLANLVLLCRAHHRLVHDHGHSEIEAPP